VPRLFALDHNFPDPILAALQRFQADAELVRIDQIDTRMPELDDWGATARPAPPPAAVGRAHHHRQEHAQPST
jgi:hypothetical protein